MIAIFEVYQTKAVPRPLTFDEIVAKLPEVERHMVPGERLCLAVLSTLEDACFPLMHKIVLTAVKKRWPDLEEYDGPPVYTEDGVSYGSYAKLSLRSVAALARGEDARTCGRRVLFQELRAIIAKESSHYQIEGGEPLAEAAIEELMGIFAPDHPVIVAREDPADGRVEILFSLVRLQNINLSMKSVVQKIAKKGTQLLMVPYVEASDFVLPQFPMYIEGEIEEELFDSSALERRRATLFHPECMDNLFRMGSHRMHYPEANIAAMMP
jgi:hypothetical protein